MKNQCVVLLPSTCLKWMHYYFCFCTVYFLTGIDSLSFLIYLDTD